MKTDNIAVLDLLPDNSWASLQQTVQPKNATYNQANFEVLGNLDKRWKDERWRQYRQAWDDVVKDGGRYRPFPVHMQIESAYACNLKCSMCYYSFEGAGFDRENPEEPFMKLDLFKKIIDEGAKEGLCSIKLNLRGEPLMNRALPDMIKYARAAGIVDVMFNTNGLLMTEAKAHQIIEASPTTVIFSIDAATDEVYQQIRVGGKLPTLVQNLQRFVKLKNEHNPNIRTRAYFIVQEKNRHELEDFMKMWTGVTDEVGHSDVSNFHYEQNPLNKEKNCSVIWRQLAIAYNGDVGFCDPDYNFHLKLGSVQDSPIKALWDGDKMNKLRFLAKQNRLNEMSPCSRCAGK